MNDECIFCRIIAGKEPVSLVYEDELVIAFMTIEQPTGHQVIIIPREHVETLFDLNDAQAAAIMQTAVKVSRAIREASNCDGLNLYQANGEAAHQDVFHFHLHLIPRCHNDETVHFDWDITRSPREVLDQMAKEIRGYLS